MKTLRWLLHSVAILVIVLYTPGYSQAPPWVISHQHINYPTSQFILGVGTGTGERAEENAKRLAQADIAWQLRVKVQTQIKSVQQTYELNQNQETYADFKIGSTSVVDEELTDAMTVETAVDSTTKTTYVLAALNKENFSGVIAAKLTAGWDQVKKLRDAAKNFLNRGNLGQAIQDLVAARASTINLLPKQALHDAIAPTPFLDEHSLGPSVLTSEIDDALSSVRIEKIGGDRQKGKIGEKFPQPFVVRVTAYEGGNFVPLVDDSIIFLNSSAVQYGEAVTDAKGVASCPIQARGGIGKQLRASLALHCLGNEFSSDLHSSSVVFRCILLDADAAFSVKVDAPSSGQSAFLRSAVADAVTHLGYQIVDMSRFMLRVELQTAPTTVDSTDGMLYSASSDATIVLIDKESNRMLGSVIGKSNGVAKTPAAAVERSVRSIKFDEPELVLLLEKAKN
ncbi:MAG: hypothetical protein WBZ48_04455 [Bacteroidota bacterium]